MSGGPDFSISPAMGMEMVVGEPVLTYGINPGATERRRTITFTPVGGPTNIVETVEIIQLAGQGVEAVTTPLDVSGLSAGGDSFTIAVTRTGSATGWSASVSGGADFYTITPSPLRLDADGTIRVVLEENMTTSARTRVITIVPEGGSGPPMNAVVSFTQQAGQGLMISPTTYAAENTDDVFDVGVDIEGSAMGWSASTMDGFITFPSGATGMGDGTIQIRHAPNPGVRRTAEVEFTTTGGSGPAATFTLVINQAGAPPIIDVTPASSSVADSPADQLTAVITLDGGAEGWSASATRNPDGFLTFSSPTTVTGSGSLLIEYAVNSGTARRGEVEFTTSGGTGAAATFTLVINQAGAPPTITVTPGSFLSLAATSADQLTAVITLGGGAESWSSSVIMNPGNFLTFPSTTGGMGSGNLLIDYPVNMGVARTGELEFTTSGGTGPSGYCPADHHAVRRRADDYGYSGEFFVSCGYFCGPAYCRDYFGRRRGELEFFCDK